MQGNPVEVVVNAKRKTFSRTVNPRRHRICTPCYHPERHQKLYGEDKLRSSPVKSTIYSFKAMLGPFRETSVSGCGEISLLKNDPGMRTIGTRTRILVNGNERYVIGTGTGSSPGRPNLSFFAELQGMDTDMMGGFVASAGPECFVSCAVLIPVLDDESLRALSALHEQIPLPFADGTDRTLLASTINGEVWNRTG